MSDLESAQGRVQQWLQPLTGDDGPCGVDLEYDNDFLSLQQSAAGKPETQFAAAEPPNWRAAFERADELLDRSRDLRIAMYWLRGGLHVHGYRFLAVGLQLLDGLIDAHWDAVHPLPDPDDGDPYARVNALTLLRENDGVLGDLRAVPVVSDRTIGGITGRQVELALGLANPQEGEEERSRDTLRQMIGDVVGRDASLREVIEGAQSALHAVTGRIEQRLGADAPDLQPLRLLVDGVAQLLPASVDASADAEDAAAAGGTPSAARAGLSGSVRSREEAVRAIDMVREYLERAEPSNPASLFLRRARQLISCDFLQLMKELAPDAMGEVARIVGVDPESVQSPEV